MNNSFAVLSGLPEEIIPIAMQPFSRVDFAPFSPSVWPDWYRFWVSIPNEPYYVLLWHRPSLLTGVEVRELFRNTVLVSSVSRSRALDYVRRGLELFVGEDALKLAVSLQVAFSDWSFGNVSSPQQTFNIRIVPPPATIKPFSPVEVYYDDHLVNYFVAPEPPPPFGTEFRFRRDGSSAGEWLESASCLNPVRNFVQACVSIVRPDPDKGDLRVGITTELYAPVGNEVVVVNHASLFVLAKRQNDTSAVFESIVRGLCAAALVCFVASLYEVCRLRRPALNREAESTRRHQLDFFLTAGFFCFALAAVAHLLSNQDHVGYAPLELSI